MNRGKMTITTDEGRGAAQNKQFRETAYVLVGGRGPKQSFRMCFKQTGNSHSVTFDWQTVMAREETSGDIGGFFHTHPPGIPNPSGRDDATMRAWISCFGKPLLCVIQCDSTDSSSLGAWEYSKQGKRKLPGVTINNGWLSIDRD